MLPSDGRLEMSQSPVNQPLSVSNTPSVLDTKTPRAVPGQDLIAYSRPAAGHARPWIAAVWAHKWLTLGIAILIAFGAWHTAHTIFGPAVVVDRATRGDLVQTVVAIGHIETPFRVEIASRITGTVEAALAEFSTIVLSVTQGLATAADQTAAQKAFVGDAPEQIVKAFSEKTANIEELTKSLQLKDEEVESLQKSLSETKESLDTATKELETIKARKSLALSDSAHKSVIVDADAPAASNEQAYNQAFARFITTGGK